MDRDKRGALVGLGRALAGCVWPMAAIPERHSPHRAIRNGNGIASKQDRNFLCGVMGCRQTQRHAAGMPDNYCAHFHLAHATGLLSG